MSGDIFGCHCLREGADGGIYWIEARNVAKHTKMHRTDSHKKFHQRASKLRNPATVPSIRSNYCPLFKLFFFCVTFKHLHV